MRILVLCTDQGVRVPGDKGASLHLTAIARAYAALGHDVLLYAVAGHEPPQDRPGLRHLLVPHPGRSEGLVRERRKLALVERFAQEGRGVVEDFRPDLIHERLALFGTAGARLAADSGVPLVLEVNALLAEEEAQWRGLHLVDLAVEREREALRAATRVVTVSDEWATRVREVAGPQAPVVTVPNGVDAALFVGPVDRAAVRARYGLPQATPLAIFTGALRPWHGVDIAVDALAHLPAEVELAIVGDGPLRPELEARARDLGIEERIHFVGQVPHGDSVDLVRSADVALAPYPALEGFAFSPLKVFEYLAAGVPFIGSDIGQVADLVTEFGAGTLVPPGDPRALARGVSRALAEDPAVGRSAALRVLRSASWTARARQVLDGLATPLDDPLLTAVLDRARTGSSVLNGVALERALRHVAGRRVTYAASRAGSPVVVKVFGSPRARGNARRLDRLAAAGLQDLVPAALGVDASGHVGVLGFRPGEILEQVDDDRFVSGAADAGRALARLHAGGVDLDRVWTHDDETAQLLRRVPESCRAAAQAEARRHVGSASLVPSHRDLHPRQVVVTADGAAFIDLDDAALAPPGLDVGNMLAHLRREAVTGRRTPAVAAAAAVAFLAGYGPHPEGLAVWERLALARLAGLAESRHGRPEERDALLALLAGLPVPADAGARAIRTGHLDRPVRIEVGPDGSPVVVKTYLRADGARIAEEMVALWASPFGVDRDPSPGMPRPLGFHAASGELRMSLVPGVAVGARGDVGRSLELGAECGRLLADLHASGIEPERRRDRRALLRSLDRKVSAVGDRSAAVVEAFAAAATALREAWDGIPGGDLVPTHGDFSPRNVLVDGSALALIDLDRLQFAERERDLAYWCAWVWVTLAPNGGPLVLPEVRPFLDAYEERAGVAVDPRALDGHLAAALIRIAHGWSSLREDDARCLEILDAARSHLLAGISAGRR